MQLPRTAHVKNLHSLAETQNVGAIQHLGSIIASSNAKWLALVSSSCGEAPLMLSPWTGVHFAHSFRLHALEERWSGQDDGKLSFRWSSLTHGVPSSPAENATCCAPTSRDDNDHHHQFRCFTSFAAYGMQTMICPCCKQFRERKTKTKERKRTGPAVFVPNATLSGCC
jgi:hypothetical protein